MTERRTASVAVLAGLALAVLAAIGRPGGSAAAARTQPTPAPTVSPGSGRFVYLRDCAWCHGEQGQGSIYGPSVQGVGAASTDFMLTTGRMPIPEPEPRSERRAPAYGPETIRELVWYVATFGPPGPEIPRLDLEGASLARGEELYQGNCAACHSSTGFGGALTSGLVAPGLEGLTATQIAEAVRIGGAGLRTGNMPRFGPDALTDEELSALVAYVLYLQDPTDRGGAALEHVGPVAEGFVALAGGLLLLLLFVRWIGPRPSVEREDHG